MTSIDEAIDNDPLTIRVKLDERESIEFLENVAELYNVGKLLFNTTLEGTEYIYRKVMIEVTKNSKLICG